MMVEHVCGNCKFWRRSNVFCDSAAGSCARWVVSPAKVLVWNNPGMTMCADDQLYFPSDFGCVEFEARPQGPFTLKRYLYSPGPDEPVGAVYCIKHDGGGFCYISGPKVEPERFCEWLNNLWQEEGSHG